MVSLEEAVDELHCQSNTRVNLRKDKKDRKAANGSVHHSQLRVLFQERRQGNIDTYDSDESKSAVKVGARKKSTGSREGIPHPAEHTNDGTQKQHGSDLRMERSAPN